MISRENFIKYINRVKDMSDIISNINKAASKLESFDLSFYEYEQIILDILVDVFDDKEDGWIAYFLYELDYGRKWHKEMITGKNGEDIPLSSAEQLYNILMDNLVEKDNKYYENMGYYYLREERDIEKTITTLENTKNIDLKEKYQEFIKEI